MLFDIRIVPTRRQHRIQREADKERHEYRRCHRDAKRVEELPDHAAHEGDRNEHGDNRESCRHDGQADFRGPFSRRRHVVLPHLHVPHDVLADNDRIVYQHTDRQRQTHQREHVQREAEEAHGDECRDHRNRERQAGDDRRAPRVQEQEHDKDREKPAKDQRDLHVLDRVADERRVVAHHPQRDARRKLRRHLLDGDSNPIGHANGVGACLFLHVQCNGRLRVDIREAARLLDTVDHLCHVPDEQRALTHALHRNVGDLRGCGASSGDPHHRLGGAAIGRAHRRINVLRAKCVNDFSE